MKLAYISPSVLPSRSANSVHVMQQCDALAKLGVYVTLFAKRAQRSDVTLRDLLRSAYGVGLERVELSTVYVPWSRANNLTIAAYAFFRVLTGGFDAVLSRNLFASFVLAVMGWKLLIVEVHQVESGFRGWMQRIACCGRKAVVVVISEQLGRDLTHLVGTGAVMMHVLHDAAPDSTLPTVNQRQSWRSELASHPAERDRFICGYVGHLYPGRGIEVIEGLARECPDILFLVIGGNEADVAERRRTNNAPNLRFLGHLAHPIARRAMSAIDLLLLPYQVKVAIGVAGQDTGRWMSPMKMFEYMASGTPFVASDLPVLREVLRDGDNAVMVQPNDLSAWRRSILELRDDPVRRQALATRAFDEYQAHYTWRSRAKRIIDLAGD
jgi:glycosyltransferase involved in cell wall biosynthesis